MDSVKINCRGTIVEVLSEYLDTLKSILENPNIGKTDDIVNYKASVISNITKLISDKCEVMKKNEVLVEENSKLNMSLAEKDKPDVQQEIPDHQIEFYDGAYSCKKLIKITFNYTSRNIVCKTERMENKNTFVWYHKDTLMAVHTVDETDADIFKLSTADLYVNLYNKYVKKHFHSFKHIFKLQESDITDFSVSSKGNNTYTFDMITSLVAKVTGDSIIFTYKGNEIKATHDYNYDKSVNQNIQDAILTVADQILGK